MQDLFFQKLNNIIKLEGANSKPALLKTSFWSYLLAQRSARKVVYVVGILQISLPIWVLNVVRLVWMEPLFYFVDICLLFLKLISVSPLSLLSVSTWRTGSDSISSRCFHVHSLFTVQPTPLPPWRNPLLNSPSPLASSLGQAEKSQPTPSGFISWAQ